VTHQENRTAHHHKSARARSSIALHGRFSHRNRYVNWSGMLSYGNRRSKPESKCSGEQYTPPRRNRRQALSGKSARCFLHRRPSKKRKKYCKVKTASTPDCISECVHFMHSFSRGNSSPPGFQSVASGMPSSRMPVPDRFVRSCSSGNKSHCSPSASRRRPHEKPQWCDLRQPQLFQPFLFGRSP